MATIKRIYGPVVAAAFCALAFAACAPKETVITREDTLANEDAAIVDLQGKIVDRQKELDSLEAERQEKSGKLSREQRDKRDNAIRKYEEFLGKYPISPYTPDVLIALGELYLERSEDQNIAALDKYEERLEAAAEAGTVVTEPEPQPHYEKTIAAYQQIALKYKDFPYADVAYYGLGYCLKAQGEEEESARTYYKLTQLYPDSAFVAEAYFRIGEYFFDQYEFDKAVKYYALVSPENKSFYDKALYKMGWAFYNQGDIGISSAEYQKAIDAFTKLIESTERKSVLTDEAMEFTAISLTEWSSDPNDETAIAKAIGHYGEAFRGGAEKDYSPGVLHQLGDVYLYKQDKLKAAATAYETLLQYYPNYDETPKVLDALVECYLREEDYDKAHETRVRIVDGYGPGSDWYENQDSLDVRHKALQRWEDALYQVAVYYNLQAERKSRTNPEESAKLYQEAIRRYAQYLAAFPTNEKAYHVNFYLAEAYYAVNDFGNAGDQYQKTALGYNDRERYKIDKWDEKFTQELALFNAIVAYDEIFQKDTAAAKKEAPTPPAPKEAAPTTAAAGENGLQTYGPLQMPVKALTLDEANLIRACSAFSDKYPDSDEIAFVLSKEGELYFYVEDYAKARDAFGNLVDNYARAPEPSKEKEHNQLYVNASENIAKSYFNEAEFYEKAGDYRTAETKYAQAKKWYARTESEAKERGVMDTLDRAKSLAGLTGIKTAEMKGAGVEIAEIEQPTVVPEVAVEEAGVEDFIVLYPPLPPIEATAFAAKQAEAQEYERNAADNQGNDVGRISLGKAADTYYKIRDWDNSARTYLEYTKAYPQAEDVKMAYEKAAECYERKEDWANAGKVYLQISEHPQYKGTPLGRDSLFRAALLYEQQEDWTRAVNTFQRYTEEYPDEAKPLLEATFRQARAEEKLGRADDALEHQKKVVGIYKYSVNEGFDMGGTEKYVAESEFKMVDIPFDDYDRIQFTMPQKVMEANVHKKIEKSQDLIAGYTDIASLGIPKWTVAAHCRMADVYLSFRDALNNAEIPEELKPEYWEALPGDDQRKPLLEEAYYKYTSQLDEQALTLEDKAVAEYTEAVNIAEGAGVDDEWSRKAYNQLLVVRPYEIVKYEDVGVQGLVSDTNWLVSNAYEDGWLDTAYDDSVWANANPSGWREKDKEKVVEQVPGDAETVWGGPEDKAVYFRKKLSFTYDPGGYTAVIQTRGTYKLYVNGTLIGQTDALTKDPWVKPDSYDVADALHLGDNVICVEVVRARDDSYGLRFALVPEGGFPSAAPASFGETGVPGEEVGGVQPEAGTLPSEEWPPPAEGEGELSSVPGEEAEFGAAPEGVKPAPAEETAPAPGEEVTPAPAEETTAAPGEGTAPAPAEETAPAAEETTPAPSEEVTPAPTEETTPAPSEEVTPAPGEETAPPAEGEALPEPGAGTEGESYDAGDTGAIDFEAVGTPEEVGGGGDVGTEAPVDEDF